MSQNRISIVLLLLVVFLLNVSGEENIVTHDGKRIKINDNFTWEYLETEETQNSIREIYPKNKNKVLINSSNMKYGVYLDNKKWLRTSGLNNEAELQFKNHDDTAFAMIIYDGLEIPIESMKEVIILNAYKIDPNARILNSEQCILGTLNGELVTYTASTAGLNFIFYTFLFSNEKGTIQFTCFTLDTEFNHLKSEFIDLISGFKY